jgi:hypothetical protein
VVLGMASVLVFTVLHPHQPHPAPGQSQDAPMN